MSIAFSTPPSDIAGFAFTCGHENGLTEHRFGSYEEASKVLQVEMDAHGFTGGLAVCGDVDYCGYGLMHIQAVETDPSPSMNVTGSNAVHLLKLLGLPSITDEDGSLAGSTAAEDFLGRVLAAQADLGERPAAAAPGFYVGRHPGYSEERLSDLRDLAAFAISRGRQIQWA